MKWVAILLELFSSIPEAWKVRLENQRENLANLSSVLSATSYLPPASSIFAALELPPESVRVILLGQDPYPNPLHATGMAFSVPAQVKVLPASLRNIFTELKEDLGVINTCGDLSSWRDQGVLLLNTVLTTSPGESDAHANLGWEIFTNEIINIVSENDPIAILWGRKAEKFAHNFAPHKVLSSAHPSPLSAYRGFFGSKPFSRVNSLLLKKGDAPIIWQIDEQ